MLCKLSSQLSCLLPLDALLAQKLFRKSYIPGHFFVTDLSYSSRASSAASWAAAFAFSVVTAARGATAGLSVSASGEKSNNKGGICELAEPPTKIQQIMQCLEMKKDPGPDKGLRPAAVCYGPVYMVWDELLRVGYNRGYPAVYRFHGLLNQILWGGVPGTCLRAGCNTIKPPYAVAVPSGMPFPISFKVPFKQLECSQLAGHLYCNPYMYERDPARRAIRVDPPAEQVQYRLATKRKPGSMGRRE
ncbi:hypothetical protein K438DRAFT_1772320 [Mycena galopus ATCC 62051]|nr:hypothetical protein K438DRAFT_1772320 [Mycena galopus ATCC 62051]